MKTLYPSNCNGYRLRSYGIKYKKLSTGKTIKCTSTNTIMYKYTFSHWFQPLEKLMLESLSIRKTNPLSFPDIKPDTRKTTRTPDARAQTQPEHRHQTQTAHNIYCASHADNVRILVRDIVLCLWYNQIKNIIFAWRNRAPAFPLRVRVLARRARVVWHYKATQAAHSINGDSRQPTHLDNHIHVYSLLCREHWTGTRANSRSDLQVPARACSDWVFTRS